MDILKQAYKMIYKYLNETAGEKGPERYLASEYEMVKV